MKKRLFLILIAFIFTLVLTSCSKGQNTKNQVLNPGKDVVCFVYDRYGYGMYELHPYKYDKVDSNHIKIVNRDTYLVLENGDLMIANKTRYEVEHNGEYTVEDIVEVEKYMRLLYIIYKDDLNDIPDRNY